MFSRSLSAALAALIVFCAATMHAQEAPRTLVTAIQLEEHLSRPVDTISFGAPEKEETGKKSPFLAAVLSFAIPGLGEYYAGEQIWRGLIFTGLEVGLWVTHNYYEKRGDDSTASFRRFTDLHASKGPYVQHMDSIISRDTGRLRLFGSYMADSNDIVSINKEEALLDSLTNYGTDPSIKDFNHRLAGKDIQQYYEMISKYEQFLPMWGYNRANFDRAAILRDNMNAQYGIADGIVWGIIINHILSAVDAALLASDHNAKLRLHGDVILRPNSSGVYGYVPTANIQLTF
jgi:TM2 domain-containing membrane protein YozV